MTQDKATYRYFLLLDLIAAFDFLLDGGFGLRMATGVRVQEVLSVDLVLVQAFPQLGETLAKLQYLLFIII